MSIADPAAGARSAGGAVRLLLDTHAFVWLATGDDRVGEDVRDLVLDPRNDLVLSVASIWELAIKSSLGKVRLQIPLASFVDGQVEALGASVLEVRRAHALVVERLPFHHRDPFDRLLVAQAIHEGLVILSGDGVFDRYPSQRLW